MTVRGVVAGGRAMTVRVLLLCILILTISGCMTPGSTGSRGPHDPGADNRIYRRTVKAWIHETYGETK